MKITISDEQQEITFSPDALYVPAGNITGASFYGRK